jgi:hypothetical protein
VRFARGHNRERSLTRLETIAFLAVRLRYLNPAVTPREAIRDAVKLARLDDHEEREGEPGIWERAAQRIAAGLAECE